MSRVAVSANLLSSSVPRFPVRTFGVQPPEGYRLSASSSCFAGKQVVSIGSQDELQPLTPKLGRFTPSGIGISIIILSYMTIRFGVAIAITH